VNGFDYSPLSVYAVHYLLYVRGVFLTIHASDVLLA